MPTTSQSTKGLKWNTLLDVAYVGSSTSQLSDNSEGIEGSNYAAIADQNKTPIGAFFSPDPKTGVQSTNPENLGTNPNFNTLTGTPTGNTAADYHPYGYAYGTASAYMNQSIAYTNYNGLQVAWIKTTGKLGYNLNATWSKTLGTSLQANPYNINLNYGPTSIDRPFVFNAYYYYNTGKIGSANRYVNGLLGGWTISGISTWQAGGYIPAALGNGVPNFNMGLTYTGLPGTAAQQKAMGLTSAIGSCYVLWHGCACSDFACADLQPNLRPRPLPTCQWELLYASASRDAGRSELSPI